MDRSRLSSPYINPFASRFTSTLYTPEKEVSLIVKGKKKKEIKSSRDIRENLYEIWEFIYRSLEPKQGDNIG